MYYYGKESDLQDNGTIIFIEQGSTKVLEFSKVGNEHFGVKGSGSLVSYGYIKDMVESSITYMKFAMRRSDANPSS